MEQHESKFKKILRGVLCLLVLGLIGFIDYRADYRVSFTAFYILPIGFAVLYLNRGFAFFLAILSIFIWIGGDFLDGAPSPGFDIEVWNAGIVFSLFLIVIYLLDAQRRIQSGLETTVQLRTQSLREEVQERKKLESEILDLTERERQRFGHEIHDVVCQELASIAIAAHLLAKKLQSKNRDEEKQAVEITQMVERSLVKARSVARGFFTDDFDLTGLAESLREIASNLEERTGVRCRINWQKNLEIKSAEVVVHLFRIAQEAMLNATKHAEATQIEVNLQQTEDHIQLTIEDNGHGLAPFSSPNKGLGLRIMAYRAENINGKFSLEKSPSGGVRVVCRIPLEKTAHG